MEDHNFLVMRKAAHGVVTYGVFQYPTVSR